MAKRRRKKKKFNKVLFVFELSILGVLIAGLYFYSQVYGKLDKTQGTGGGAADFNVENVDINQAIIADENIQGYQNIALIGIDNDYNGDTMLIASIDGGTKEIKLLSVYRDTYLNMTGTDDEFAKANHAYSLGFADNSSVADGAESVLSMMNRNFDLNITDYVAVHYDALAEVVDELGGIEITMTYDEAVHLNNYCVSVSKVTGKEYEDLPEEDGTYTLSGVQAVSYARIRYTAGGDYKRTQRQRLVISKIMEKAKKADLGTLNNIMDAVFPMISTSFSKSEIIKLGTTLLSYSLADTTGFPFVVLPSENGEYTYPVTLSDNVIQLHQYLFGVDGYSPSETVQGYSDYIVEESGYGSDSVQDAQEYSSGASVKANTGSESDGK